MPHVVIKCFPGRTEEQKTKCAEEVTKAIAETMGCNESTRSCVTRASSRRTTGKNRYGIRRYSLWRTFTKSPDIRADPL